MNNLTFNNIPDHFNKKKRGVYCLFDATFLIGSLFFIVCGIVGLTLHFTVFDSTP